jgi:hypothetical protein
MTSLDGLRILEDFVQGNAEGACDLERHFERWGVAPLLDGDDGLAGDPDAVGESACSFAAGNRRARWR